MVWFEILNSVSCTLLLVAMLPLASVIDVRRNPVHAMLMIVAELAFFLQTVAPMFPEHLPPVAWQTSLLHLTQAVCVLLFRKRLWQFALAELAAIKAPHPLRRATDIARAAER